MLGQHHRYLKNFRSGVVKVFLVGYFKESQLKGDAWPRKFVAEYRRRVFSNIVPVVDCLRI